MMCEIESKLLDSSENIVINIFLPVSTGLGPGLDIQTGMF